MSYDTGVALASVDKSCMLEESSNLVFMDDSSSLHALNPGMTDLNMPEDKKHEHNAIDAQKGG
jgi:hypothetical protein